MEIGVSELENATVVSFIDNSQKILTLGLPRETAVFNARWRSHKPAVEIIEAIEVHARKQSPQFEWEQHSDSGNIGLVVARAGRLAFRYLDLDCLGAEVGVFGNGYYPDEVVNFFYDTAGKVLNDEELGLLHSGMETFLNKYYIFSAPQELCTIKVDEKKAR